MRGQIPDQSVPRRHSYARSFASIRGFNLPASPTAPVPSRLVFIGVHSWFKSSRHPIASHYALHSLRSLRSLRLFTLSLQTRNPEPCLHSCQQYSPSNPAVRPRRPPILPPLFSTTHLFQTTYTNKTPKGNGQNRPQNGQKRSRNRTKPAKKRQKSPSIGHQFAAKRPTPSPRICALCPGHQAPAADPSIVSTISRACPGGPWAISLSLAN
jgi:hypothetical protein